MAIKTLYLDVETTGLDPRQHGLIQLAGIMEFDGIAQAETNWHIRTFAGDIISEKELEITGITVEQIQAFPAPQEVKLQIETWLKKFINKYDKTDKLYVAGQNVNFDMEFLAEFWRKSGDLYFGSYFNRRKIDLLAMIDQLCWMGHIHVMDRKLQTICDMLGVQLGERAHDALADIRATRECIIKLRDMFYNRQQD